MRPRSPFIVQLALVVLDVEEAAQGLEDQRIGRFFIMFFNTPPTCGGFSSNSLSLGRGVG